MDKKLLRKKAKEIRCNIDIETINNKIVDNIINSNLFKKSKNIMIFYPLENEINLLRLLNIHNINKNFYLPRMCGKNLECCPYKIDDELSIKKYGIKEPVCNSIDKNCLDLIILPALSVDKKGNRLGYGGGYYDRFCYDTNCKKAVVIPECLFVDNIPSEQHDIKINYIFTENGINKIQ